MKNNDNNEQICSVCEAQPQDMLILSCRHNLCLDCATEVYHLNMKDDKIVCEICLSDTKLDEDTIICLRSLSAKNIRQSQMQNSQYNIPSQQNRQAFPSIPKSNISSNHKPNYNHHQIQKSPQVIIEQTPIYGAARCQKHHQPLTYYCLDCNNFKICSQCMLMDNHRFHKVITLKKATIQIKQTIQKVIRQKENLKCMLEKDRHSLLMRKEQSEKQLQLNINQLKQTFQQINKLVLERYTELTKTMEEQASRKLQIMQGAINQIEHKIQLIEETIQFEQQLIKETISKQSGHNSDRMANAMHMFEYYEKEISQGKVDFQPQLPNYIQEVQPQTVYQSDNIFQQLEQLLGQITITTACQQDQYQDPQQDEIKYISQIDQRQIMNQRQRNFIKPKRNYEDGFLENQPQIHKKQLISVPNYPRPISQNINIIQLNSFAKPTLKQHPKQTSSAYGKSKVSKQTVQAIKKKARQNLNDRQLSQSRKMQLSRSISNATDILNKIQQRSSRI